MQPAFTSGTWASHVGIYMYLSFSNVWSLLSPSWPTCTILGNAHHLALTIVT